MIRVVDPLHVEVVAGAGRGKCPACGKGVKPATLIVVSTRDPAKRWLHQACYAKVWAAEIDRVHGSGFDPADYAAADEPIPDDPLVNIIPERPDPDHAKAKPAK